MIANIATETDWWNSNKTLSYLVAAIVAKHYNGMTYGQNLPVTITTSSIELQKALVEREIPNLSKMLMDYHIIDEPLTAVLRKGKEHYLCRYAPYKTSFFHFNTSNSTNSYLYNSLYHAPSYQETGADL